MRDQNDHTDHQIAAFLQQTKQGVSMAAKILSLDAAKLVRAAGGVIIRPGRGGDRVAVIHRPRYDDWTFPKGKLQPGEDDLDAALREVAEETGLWCRAEAELTETDYVDRRGRPKTVRYWAMTPESGRFTPGDEVDRTTWLEPPAAAALLTYDRDLEVLQSFLEFAGAV